MINSLLIIDPQNDFCDPAGSLAVPAAAEDCLRIAAMIKRIGDKLSSIYVTLDTHHLFHIANPSFWLDAGGNCPPPYTIITEENMQLGEFRASLPEYKSHAAEYVKELARRGKHRLCIWPPHCLIGTWGHNVYKPLSDALLDWEKAMLGRIVEYIEKGKNPKTEHYSAIRAEVEDAADSSTGTNFALIEKLKGSDNIAIAGEALSHCLANTVRDLAALVPAEKLIILTDCSSNVSGFENLGEAFLEEAKSMGVRSMTSTEFLG